MINNSIQNQRQFIGESIFYKGECFEIKHPIENLKHKLCCKMVAETVDGERAIVVDLWRRCLRKK